MSRINWAVYVAHPERCLLCDVWNSLPHAQRYTSPTTVSDTAQALDLGFWTALSTKPIELCPMHVHQMRTFDRSHEEQQEVRKAETIKPPSTNVAFLIGDVPRTQRQELMQTVQSLVDNPQRDTDIPPPPPPLPPDFDPNKIPCGICGVSVTRGEVHMCAVDEGDES